MQYINNNVSLFEDWLIENADPTIADVLRRIVVAGKNISSKIRRAAIEHLCTSTTITNYHGEEVKTLDVVSNDQFITNLKKSKFVAAMISEEDFSVIKTNNTNGKYIITFDPLDGSSNIDANVNIGSIFGIYQKKSDEVDETDYLRAGKEMIGAGYILYGSSTMLVLSLGTRVDGFCLDDNIGEFILTHPDMKIPKNKKIYSINEGNCSSWSQELVDMINDIKSQNYSQRYIGSMVADVHRTILYGGLFMYPASVKAPNGKLRYLYEVAPMSYLIEKAGGKSTIGKVEALEYVPKSIHERTPVFMGSEENMKTVEKYS